MQSRAPWGVTGSHDRELDSQNYHRLTIQCYYPELLYLVIAWLLHGNAIQVCYKEIIV